MKKILFFCLISFLSLNVVGQVKVTGKAKHYSRVVLVNDTARIVDTSEIVSDLFLNEDSIVVKNKEFKYLNFQYIIDTLYEFKNNDPYVSRYIFECDNFSIKGRAELNMYTGIISVYLWFKTDHAIFKENDAILFW